MPASRAIVSTASASRYLQQLCKHWGHKFEATFDSRQGRVALPFGPLELVATDDALSVTCRLDGDGDLDIVGNVEEHFRWISEKPVSFFSIVWFENPLR